MTKFSQKFLGVPFARRDIREVVEEFARTRDIPTMRATIGENLAHITGKSGALLQAQGIFFVVATYVLERGWPRYLAFATMFLQIAAALIVMTNLRSVYIGRDPSAANDHDAELGMLVQGATLAARRGMIFNIALYLTFLSVVLLGVGAVAAAV